MGIATTSRVETLRIAEGVELPIDYVTKTAAILAQRRKGKRLALDTPLPTPTGWTTMRDVRVGDELFDELGEPCRVTYVADVTWGDSYRVCFSDGSEIVADAEHLWLTESRSARRRESAIKAGILTGDGREGRPQCQQAAVTMPQVRTTAEIAATLRDGSDTNHSIRVALPLDLPDCDLPVDPYVLGLWLGDGTRCFGSVTAHDSDLSIFDHARRAGYEVREQPSQRNGGTGSYTILGLRPQLRALGVLGEKHVPGFYLRASESQRLALLQGIADADGSCSEQGQVEISVSDPRLARDVYELVVSLGIKATRTWRETYAKPSCRVRFTTTTPVFRLARKLRRQPTTKGPQASRRFIVSVEPTASVPMRCIAVDSSSRLFLAGESMIPTHNTYTGSVLAEELVRVRLPWVALDPTGAWWGLRSSADGLAPGLPVVVLGGQHGDLPLEARAGAAIADLVLDHPGWYVLDLSLLEGRPAEREFATAFATRLHRRKMQPGMDFPLHLFIDEADLFVPQEKDTKGDVPMLAAFNGIVRRGGIHGLGATLISQRPALVNKSVLTQLDLLILLRLVAGQDQDAVDKNYIARSSTREQRAELMDSLASLPVGEGWLFEPGAEPPLLERVRIRQRRTFNSSATPKAGEQRIEPSVFADVDLDAARDRLADAVERALADDPAELRRRIASERRRADELAAELHDLRAWAANVEDADDGPTAIDALIATYVAAKARVGYSCDLIDEARALATAPREPLATVEHLDAIWKLVQAAKDAGETLAAEVRDLAQPLAAAILRATEAAEHVASRPVRAGTDAREEAAARVESRPGGQQERAVVGLAPAAAAPPRADGDLSTGARHLLATLGEHYPMRPTVGQLGLLAKRKPRGGAWNSAMKQLRDGDYVREADGLLVLTSRGTDATGVAGMPADPAVIRERWRDALPAAARDLYDLLASIYPRAMSVEELAARTGRKPQGGSWNTAVATLTRNGLVTRRNEGLALTTEGYGE